jgi:hypothetical protein
LGGQDGYFTAPDDHHKPGYPFAIPDFIFLKNLFEY